MAGNIFIRGNRPFIVELAKVMNWQFNPQHKSTQRLGRRRSVRQQLVEKLVRKSALPAPQWVIPYRYLVGDLPENLDLLIEPGSHLISSKIPYVVYVENGLGLYAYNYLKYNRVNRFVVRRRLSDRNLKGLIFYSETARKVFYTLHPEFDGHFQKDLGVAYPYVVDQPRPSAQEFVSKFATLRQSFNLLFCGADFILKGGRELVQAVDVLRQQGMPINLRLVTKLDSVPSDVSLNSEYIFLEDFKLRLDQVYERMRAAHLFCLSSYIESHGLVLIEAAKNFTPVLAVESFAVREVLGQGAGPVVENPVNVFDETFLPKDRASITEWYHRLSERDFSNELSALLVQALAAFYQEPEKYFSYEGLCGFCDRLSASKIIATWERVADLANS